MATGMRALLDTVVQALPQVRVPPPGGPPGWCRCLTGPDFPSPAGPEPGAVIEGKGPLCLFLPDQGLTVPALFLALSCALRTHMRPSGVSRLPQGRVGKGGGGPDTPRGNQGRHQGTLSLTLQGGLAGGGGDVNGRFRYDMFGGDSMRP